MRTLGLCLFHLPVVGGTWLLEYLFADYPGIRLVVVAGYPQMLTGGSCKLATSWQVPSLQRNCSFGHGIAGIVLQADCLCLAGWQSVNFHATFRCESVMAAAHRHVQVIWTVVDHFKRIAIEKWTVFGLDADQSTTGQRQRQQRQQQVADILEHWDCS